MVMTAQLKESIRDSKSARWFVLITVSFLMLTGYFFTDIMSPLQGMLRDQMGWSNSSYGTFAGSYSVLNVFCLMLIFGGIILDKAGIRFTGTFFVGVMIVGAFLNYYAMTDMFNNGGIGYDFLNSFLTDYKPSLKMAMIGYALFGVGVEIAGITVSRIIVKWFKGKEMALAMGLEMACARGGMLIAFSASPWMTGADKIISRPLAFGVILLVIGLLAFFIHNMMDKKLDAEVAADTSVESSEDEFKISDVFLLFKNPGFILIALLCVLFYSAIFPFTKFAPDLMVQKYGFAEELSGMIVGLLPIGTMVLTPIFGAFMDKKGKSASIMMLGSLLLIFSHVIFAFLPGNTAFAFTAMVVLGFAFSFVPAAMWPSVPKIIPESRLGSAYAMIFMIQNVGLMLFPMLLGTVLDSANEGIAEGAALNYTEPMMLMVGCGIAALLVAFRLRVVDKKKGYGLDLPNIEK
ncbi:MFS transporter [Labilibaculum sp. DW002]|uniref:Lysosomal dipeptide transporter MFSD1 n=1 Tax=Paralabilibaculum antarcticum TaxID=2912572 RepID=A0ABT5VTM5_9BACT|nr:MFS transporter [Labilibaculum sp. DW002]MDE5418779.1 MFS transporter [Labilibaculum sp. DW002]